MTIPEQIKKKALSLSKKLSADKVVQALDKEFPPNEVPCAKTVYRWRKERSNRALGASRKQDSTLPRPPADARREDHFDRLVDMAITLLGEKPRKISQEIVWTPNGTLPPIPLEENMSKRRLSQALAGAHDSMLISGEQTLADFSHLEAHLRHESAIIRRLGLTEAMKKDPRELVYVLRLLARRKTFKGKCEVCKDL